MKVRKGRSQKIVVEMDRRSPALPPIALPEFRLRRILVPVDFSECSLKALEYAVSFAKQFSAEVMLLHVVVAIPPPPQMLVLEAETLRGKYYEEAAKRLSEWRKKVVSRASVKATVRQGTSAHQEIIAAAQECNSDLIVIGNHGRSGLTRVLTGSTAERVVRHAPCPVLVVRGREHEFLVGASEIGSAERSVAV
jgi:nucleotide-binding universal stress UspA family protein